MPPTYNHFPACKCAVCSQPLPAPHFGSEPIQALKRQAYVEQRRAYRALHPHVDKADCE